MRAFPTLFFFIFIFLFTIAPVKAGPPAPEVVVDTSGEKLRAGGSYFIIPYIKGHCSGLTFDTFGNSSNDTTSCPRVVVPVPFINSNKALPVQFLPSNPNDRVVYTSTNLNIQFTRSPKTALSSSSCEEESRVWKMTKFISEGMMNIGTNGEVGNHDDFSAVFNWFKIEKAQGYNTKGVYTLTFCSKPGVVTCNDIGVFSYGGRNYLGITNPHHFHSYPVVFSRDYGDLVMTT